MNGDWSYSFGWTQPYPNWKPVQLRIARDDAHYRATKAELARLDALEEQVQTADLTEVANLLNSLKNKS